MESINIYVELKIQYVIMKILNNLYMTMFILMEILKREHIVNNYVKLKQKINNF